MINPIFTQRKEFDRFKQARSLIKTRFPSFGINKQQETIRLLYEISKRESIDPQNVLSHKPFKNFSFLKQYLVKRRFPYAFLHDEINSPYLPKLDLKPTDCANPGKIKFSPTKIFIEKSVRNSTLARRFRKTFPRATFQEITSLKNYPIVRQFRSSGILPTIVGSKSLRSNCHTKETNQSKLTSYNKRRELVFIVEEKHDFFKKCPCTQGALGCDYHIVNLGLGCIFECTYCYLQEYANSPGIILPVNIDRFFGAFASYKKRGMRLGTGEFSDSLMLDHITEYSLPLIKFFGQHKDVTLEFKTKSNRINNLLKANHKGNIVVSWSLNPQRIIDENEFLTASLKERLRAASQCVEAGYRVGFHFDPIFSFRGWEKEYGKVLEILFNKIKPKHIAWISLGTFRFKPPLKKIIEARFPQNRILDEELLLGYDNKMRYPYSIRYNIYKSLSGMLQKHSKKLPVYLCMEEQAMWRDLKLALPF